MNVFRDKSFKRLQFKIIYVARRYERVDSNKIRLCLSI